MHSSDLRIKVHQNPSYTSKQPKSDVLPPTPLRGIILGPSGSGKTVVLVDMILRLYRGVFERIFIFSPSVHLDSTWLPVKRYVEQELGIDQREEPSFFDTWDTTALREIYETQVAVIKELKKRKSRQMFNILIVVDDFADDPKVMHQTGGYSAGGSMLNTLFVRGRHAYISTLVSTQKLRLTGSTLRVNAQFILCWRLRNELEKRALLEELSAVYPVKVLEDMYNLATEEPYSFWYILLTAKRKEDMFFLRFEHRMIPNINTEEKWGASSVTSQEPLPEPPVNQQTTKQPR